MVNDPQKELKALKWGKYFSERAHRQITHSINVSKNVFDIFFDLLSHLIPAKTGSGRELHAVAPPLDHIMNWFPMTSPV